jgi:hypothetical protein
MVEWIVVIITVFNIFFGVYRGPQTQVRNYQTQYPQVMASPYGPQGTQGYYYGQPPQAVAYPQGY